MNYFLNLPVWKKLVLILLVVGLVPMAIIGAQSISNSNTVIENQVFNQLSAVRTVKADEVKRYFEQAKKQIQVLSSNPVVVDAADKLPEAFNNFRTEASATLPSLSVQKEKVISYYNNEFGQQYRKTTGKELDVSTMHSGLDADSWALQYQYIAANSHKQGYKDGLVNANDNSQYSDIHATVHPMLREFLHAFGYYDIFIADPDTGDIIYSVFKELDYTTSLIDGPFATSNIGEVFKKAQSLTENNQTALVDFKAYLPSYNAPANFIASPIYNGQKRVGILIVQLPIEGINAIMSEHTGMGKTGETYLVGNDHLMRSDSYVDPEHHSVISSFKNPATDVAVSIAVDKALAGESGTGIVKNYLGRPVLSAYMPLEFGDFTWAVLAEQDTTEAFAPAQQLKKAILLDILICTLVVIGIAYYLSKLISQPIRNVMQAIIAAEKTGSFDNKVNYKNKDEIGQMASAFDGFLDSLAGMFKETNEVLQEVSTGKYESVVTGHYSGDMGLLCDGLNSTISTINQAQHKQNIQQQELEKASQVAQLKQVEIEKTSAAAELKAREAEESAIKASEAAREANRVRQALDVAGTAVLMSDANNEIIYINQAMSAIFHSVGDHIPGLSKESVIGTNISVICDKETGTTLSNSIQNSGSALFKISRYTFSVSASPIMDGREQIGTVIEWKDRTKEVNIEKEIDAMISEVASGNFSVELQTDDKEGFFLSLAKGLNSMTGTTKSVINDAANVVQSMAEGDLTNRITASYTGTFAVLTDSINQTTEKLVEVITNINDSADQVSCGAHEIEQGIVDLSGRTEQQAASLEETASSMNEMTESVAANASKTNDANQMSQDAERRASEGGEVVKKAIDAMQSINSSSKQIADIISVIDEIAFQTNLLALNAAVEAARAGDQGRGFAVVASEVRTLAQRSSEAAREIKELITDSVAKVKIGTDLVNHSGETLGELVESVEQVSKIISELSGTSTEQEGGIRQVNMAINQMDEMTQQNSALVEEATASSENVASQAQAMAKSIGFFRTGSANASPYHGSAGSSSANSEFLRTGTGR